MKATTIVGLIVGVIFAIGGCASHPNDILAESIPASQYKAFSCEELENELAQSKNNLKDAEKRQKRKRTQDGWSNALLIPGASSLIKDSSEAVARYKGEVQTLIRAIDSRCSGEQR